MPHLLNVTNCLIEEVKGEEDGPGTLPGPSF
jgi:hypothetical protein